MQIKKYCQRQFFNGSEKINIPFDKMFQVFITAGYFAEVWIEKTKFFFMFYPL
jgi:hypothetical protein